MSRFDFTLKNILGIKMEKADRLSKILDCKIGRENDNENQKLIKEEWIWELSHTIQQSLTSIVVATTSHSDQ